MNEFAKFWNLVPDWLEWIIVSVFLACMLYFQVKRTRRYVRQIRQNKTPGDAASRDRPMSRFEKSLLTTIPLFILTGVFSGAALPYFNPGWVFVPMAILTFWSHYWYNMTDHELPTWIQERWRRG